MKHEYVGPAYLKSSAAIKTRLMGFDDTYKPAGYALKSAHRVELKRLADFVAHKSKFSYWLVGYASKIGDEHKNKILSEDRCLSVEKYLTHLNPRFGDYDRLAQFRGMGDEGYIAARDDDSWDERAVEVHIFLGSSKPPPPPHVHMPKPPPLPGGKRYSNWQVACPGGASAYFIIGGGFNIFYIKNTKLNELRGYIQPVAGAGYGLGLSKLKTVVKTAESIIWKVLTGVSGSAPHFTPVTSADPVTWKEVEACLVTVKCGHAGLVKGVGIADITFACPGVYHYGRSRVPIIQPMNLWNFTTHGKNWSLGVGGSAAFGPLFRIHG